MRGQFCGVCLLNRYGEDAVEAISDKVSTGPIAEPPKLVPEINILTYDNQLFSLLTFWKNVQSYELHFYELKQNRAWQVSGISWLISKFVSEVGLSTLQRLL